MTISVLSKFGKVRNVEANNVYFEVLPNFNVLQFLVVEVQLSWVEEKDEMKVAQLIKFIMELANPSLTLGMCACIYD